VIFFLPGVYGYVEMILLPRNCAGIETAVRAIGVICFVKVNVVYVVFLGGFCADINITAYTVRLFAGCLIGEPDAEVIAVEKISLSVIRREFVHIQTTGFGLSIFSRKEELKISILDVPALFSPRSHDRDGVLRLVMMEYGSFPEVGVNGEPSDPCIDNCCISFEGRTFVGQEKLFDSSAVALIVPDYLNAILWRDDGELWTFRT
jgi:hypothetical protein